MSKRNLLICFDAFGTLFTPKTPVARQYAEVATTLCSRSFGEDEVSRSFKTAYKNESKKNPNFGKANGLNPEKWWTNPLIGKDEKLPSKLAPKLLHRFWSEEGYMLLPGASLLLNRLRTTRPAGYESVVVGVITNSDPRVPDILSSLGVRVSPLRYGKPVPEHQKTKDNDIEFFVMSYDLGHEKPDSRIFAAAEGIGMLDQGEELQATRSGRTAAKRWEKIYIGDEYDKDVVGAVDAGWKAILVDSEHQGRDSVVWWREHDPVGTLQELFGSSSSVGFKSLSKLAEWIH
ncbi:hypothetical protein LTR37_018985 [Vermiconidia calcicola]|uniref:Uncharacterized protein n=1 Tax=Vermiconidia calcicola TaxID=1690605 RepID=A0ACC3MFF9_9PEZI|nr:hypothetical protein LTR37_018985 [Vermiconidia calcicola]